MGVHIGPNDIPEKFTTPSRELNLNEMTSLAISFGLKAKSSKITVENLISIVKKKQQILRLKNGRYIIALRLGEPKILSFSEMQKILDKVKNYKSG